MRGLPGTGTLVIAWLLFGCGVPLSVSGESPGPVLGETPHLRELLREEMRALQEAMRTLASALPQGDFATVARTARAMRDSYIFQSKLNDKDRQRLHAQLPHGFVELDRAFHQRAARLYDAATRHDSELSVYHASRLLEACVQCHRQYAGQRFPVLQAPPPLHQH